jgi:CRP-like cAMP-binding protein
MAAQDTTALVRFFQSMHASTDAVAKEMASHFHPAGYKKGTYFLAEGKRSNDYLFLEEGIMRSYLFDTEGTEVTTAFYSAGSVVFEAASFFQHIPSQENIQALTDCTGWKITFEELNAIFHALPAFRETGRAILVKTLVALKMRTLSMINKTAEQRYAALLSSSPQIFQHVPLKYIASYLGITDTSLSRIRKEFVQR